MVCHPHGRVDIPPASVEKSVIGGERVAAHNRFSSNTRVLGFKGLTQDVTKSRAAYFPTPAPSRVTAGLQEIKISLGLKGE